VLVAAPSMTHVRHPQVNGPGFILENNCSVLSRYGFVEALLALEPQTRGATWWQRDNYRYYSNLFLALRQVRAG
jgi:hypothetical protein